ncbi:MAG TPA: hypothetical protein PLF91_08840, partial [Mycolicibacterium fallax]|nr:hypothetical protein [Mycolicibacterium fallax]
VRWPRVRGAFLSGPDAGPTILVTPRVSTEVIPGVSTVVTPRVWCAVVFTEHREPVLSTG